jgi:hypothetical protein
MGLLDELRKSQYLQMAEEKLQGLLNIPTEAQRFLTNPQAFMGLLGKNELLRETGFAAGATGLPPKNVAPGGLLNPPNLAYQTGYEQGEPFSYAAMAAPFTKGMPVGASIKDVSGIAKSIGKNEVLPLQIGDKTIPVTMHKIEAKEGNELVNVNTNAFDKAFKKTEWQYVGKNAEGGKPERIAGVEKYLETGKPINASNVVVKDNGTIVFGDGRHRYAVLRDMGLGKIPMSMDKESLQNAIKFGYID